MAGVKLRNSCKNLCKRSKILSLPCEYIFPLILFNVNNQEHFKTHSAVQSVTQGIKISFIDQLSISHVLRRLLITLA
jgi:hypothetical protein